MTRRSPSRLSILLGCSIMLPALALSADKPPQKGSSVKEVKTMSEKDQTALALSAAPAHISKDASVMIYGADGKLTEVRKGTNGFTCIPDCHEPARPRSHLHGRRQQPMDD